MSSVPEEIILMIADELKDMTYVSKVQGWIEAEKCYRGLCKPRDHFTKAQFARVYFGCYGLESEVDECLEEDIISDLEHKSRVDTHLRKLEENSKKRHRFTGRFNIYRQVSHEAQMAFITTNTNTNSRYSTVVMDDRSTAGKHWIFK